VVKVAHEKFGSALISSLRKLCVLSVSAVSEFLSFFHRRDAEVAEVTLRKTKTRTLPKIPFSPMIVFARDFRLRGCKGILDFGMSFSVAQSEGENTPGHNLCNPKEI